MFPSWKCLPIALAFAGLLATARAADFYVAPTGLDTNPGTAAQPFRQIRRALTFAITPGSNVYVADGAYLGFNMTNLNGTAQAPIRIVATGSNAEILVTTDRSDNRDTIYINNCFHVVVEGLRSFAANRAALRIQDGGFVTVRRCVFGNNTRWGILTGQSPDLLIEENECYGSQIEHGIYVANSGDRPTVRRNRVYNNRRSGIQLNADVHTPPGDGIITNALIEGNVIYGNGLEGGGALNLDGVQYSLIRNNLLYGNLASGIIMFQIDGAEGPRGNRVLHNTVDMPSNGRWALSIQQNSVGATGDKNFVRNNILLHRNTGVRGGLLFATVSDSTGTDTNYNVLNHVSTDNGNTRMTLANWQVGGRDLQSSTGTPSTLFIDDAQGCYLLKDNAPAIDQGVVLTDSGSDYEGSPRPGLPDPGCYEQGSLTMELQTAPGPALIIRAGTTAQCVVSSSSDLITWTVLQTLPRNDRRVSVPFQKPESPLYFKATQ